MDQTSVETIMLTEYRYLGVAWKEGKVHSMCIAITSAVAQDISERSLRHKAIANEVYNNIEKMVRLL
jgi:hypothetical protein